MTDFVRRLACAAAIATLSFSTASAAPQDAIKLTQPKQSAATGDAQQQTQQAAPPAWAAACSGASRNKRLDCAVEQRLLLQNGQLVTLVRISIPADTGKPTLLVEAPLGVALRAGLVLQLDGQDSLNLEFQTCDQAGCYATAPAPPAFLDRMLAAKTLTVRVLALNGRPISVPLPMDGFLAAYGKIS